MPHRLDYSATREARPFRLLVAWGLTGTGVAVAVGWLAPMLIPYLGAIIQQPLQWFVQLIGMNVRENAIESLAIYTAAIGSCGFVIGLVIGVLVCRIRR